MLRVGSVTWSGYRTTPTTEARTRALAPSQAPTGLVALDLPPTFWNARAMVPPSAAAPSTVAAYLAGLPADRRALVTEVRARIARVLPEGYEETFQYRMIAWVIPASRYPDTYNGHPLAVVALAAQKRHCSLYLMGCYGSDTERERFEAAYAASGKKLSMGKSCLRFSTLDDVAWEAVEGTLRRVTPELFIAQYEAARAQTKAGRPKERSLTKPTTTKPATARKKTR
jgi:uncharacterized protein YdhG (YjbR/CyaY superfamily)